MSAWNFRSEDDIQVGGFTQSPLSALSCREAGCDGP
jgi:hypothetical protein